MGLILSIRMSKYARGPDGEYLCPYCPFTAKSKNPSTMHYHIKKHEGIKNYKCAECDQSFIQRSGLTQHIALIHSDCLSGEIKCPYCSVCTARTKANLFIHIGRVHGDGWIPRVSGSGPCVCDGCGKVCQSSGAYYYHAVKCFECPEYPENLKTVLSS